MTIEEHIRKKARLATTGIIAGSATMILAGVFINQIGWLGALFAVVVFVMSLIPVFWLIRCPRCKGNLQGLYPSFGPFAQLGRKITCCPYCGVNLDEQQT